MSFEVGVKAALGSTANASIEVAEGLHYVQSRKERLGWSITRRLLTSSAYSSDAFQTNSHPSRGGAFHGENRESRLALGVTSSNRILGFHG
jgi:hypothetical protein